MIELRRLLAFCLVLTFVLDPALLLAEHKADAVASAPTPSTLTKDQQVLHALNRLTFGPRPGDVEKVKAIGLEKWIDQQLSPEKIDDGALDTRLAAYPAMQLSQRDLLERFPSQAAIRAIAAGREGLPEDRVERAIYANQVAYYRQKLAEKEMDKSAATNRKDAAMNEATITDTATTEAAITEGDAGNLPSMAAQEHRLYSDLEATQIVNLPPQQRVDKLIDMKPGEFRAFRKGLTPDERQQLASGLTPGQREILVALESPIALVFGEVAQTRLLTDIYSERQLQAVMTDFWLNHFNVYGRKGPYAAWYLADYQRNVVAPRAMGKFEDLLVATAKSPAMLFYLDNFSSIGPHSQAVTMAATRAAKLNAMGRSAPFAQKLKDRGLNENYAREVMELHTLGVDGGYTQKDVTEVAKVFTGWTIENKPQRGNELQGGEFQFDERRHEPGRKQVLDTDIKQDGMKEGLKVLHMLATSPATAQFLAKKLAVRFVSDDPPRSLTDRMAQTFLKTDGDIRQVLKTMFNSPEFWQAGAYRAKVKTPEEFLISAVRASGGQVVRVQPLVQALNQLGMPLYGMQTPNGYSWKADAWVNAGDLLARINFAMALASNRMGTIADLAPILQSDEPLSNSGKEARLETALLNGEITLQTRETVLKQVEANPDVAGMPVNGEMRQNGIKEVGHAKAMDFSGPIPQPNDNQAAMLAGLLLGSPDFQRR